MTRSAGWHHTKESKEKIRKSALGNKRTLGYKHTKITKLRLSKSKLGKNNPHWHGGRGRGYAGRIIKRLGLFILCSICGSNRFLCVHHIDGNQNNNLLNNLKVVCKSCHSKIHETYKNCKR